MLIGGSPGSTAGGMKTTTIAVLILNANGTFRHRDEASAFFRRISDQTVKIAATIFALYLTLFTVSAMIISLVESLPLLTCMFETASAIGTVGLTLGITPNLGQVSRMILIFLMYFGRVGGLTLIYAAVPTRRMAMKNILIIGLGRFGRHCARKLNEMGHQVMAVDVREDRVDAVLPYVTDGLIGNSTRLDFMKTLAVRGYDVCIVAIGDVFQVPLETTALLKDLGAQYIVARAARDVHARFLARNGADEGDLSRKTAC